MGNDVSTEDKPNEKVEITETTIVVYILKLQQEKYYIGKTNTDKGVNKRFDEHCQGGSMSAEWTKKYKPLEIIKEINNASDFDEDRYVLEYMEKYGIDNVRGGSYSSIKLTDLKVDEIHQKIQSATNKCFKCGRGGHFVKNCYAKTNVYGDMLTPEEKVIEDPKVIKEKKVKQDKYESVEILTDDELRVYNELSNWRYNTSVKEEVELFYVLNNNTLKDLAHYKPKNIEDLKRIKGIGDVKVNKYSKDIFNILSKH
jgi:superfamily II DNA helicase RecQ